LYLDAEEAPVGVLFSFIITIFEIVRVKHYNAYFFVSFLSLLHITASYPR